jgi:hypothetical protein
MTVANRSKDRIYPDFLILGAEQSGTTPLARSFRCHPRLFIPSCELQFFSYHGSDRRYTNMIHKGIVNGLDQYLSYFTSAPLESRVGEKSVSYFHRDFYTRSIENLKLLHPSWESLKIIIVLSNPLERAFAHYKINSPVHEPLAFPEALQAWPLREKEGLVPAYDYIGSGYYADSLAAYLRAFKEVKVILAEDLLENPAETISSLLSFLGVEVRPLPPPFETQNAVRRIWWRWKPLLRGRPPLPFSMDGASRRFLAQAFRDDIRRVEAITSRDLSHWC